MYKLLQYQHQHLNIFKHIVKQFSLQQSSTAIYLPLVTSSLFYSGNLSMDIHVLDWATDFLLILILYRLEAQHMIFYCKQASKTKHTDRLFAQLLEKHYNQKSQWDNSRIVRTSRTTIQTKTSILQTQVVQDSCQKVRVLSQISFWFS